VAGIWPWFFPLVSGQAPSHTHTTPETFYAGVAAPGPFLGVIVDVVGTNAEMILETGALTLDSSCFLPGATCRSFGGSFPAGVAVFPGGGGKNFEDDLSGGIIATTGVFRSDFLCLLSACTAVIKANLEPNANVVKGTAFFSVAMTNDGLTDLRSGSAVVTYQHIPEPSALEGLLLGTGVLGLAELTRRKLKVGT
jgi:hypothetical protein